MKEHCRYAVKDFRPLIVGEEESSSNKDNNNIISDNHIIIAGAGPGLTPGPGLAPGQRLAPGQGLGLGLESLRLLDRSSDDSGESKSKVLDNFGSFDPVKSDRAHATVPVKSVAVSRENSFGFFDPLTRACFQGHLRLVG